MSEQTPPAQAGTTRRLANGLIVAGVVVAALAVFLLLRGRGQPAEPTAPGAATPTLAPAAAAPSATAAGQPPAQLPAPGVTEVAVVAAGTAAPIRATPSSAAAAPEATVAAPLATAIAEPPAMGQPNRIVIPKIDLDTPIVDVGWKVIERDGLRFSEWETADNAAGRHINSARPGQPGNVVLSGHHNTRGEVFRRISDLELAPGDAIYLYDEAGRRFTYLVDEVTDPPLLELGASPEQRLANARYIQPTSDARVTLVTCWPYWTNTHRVIVVGKLQE